VWQHNGDEFYGCEQNPNGDARGKWCEIVPGSCSGTPAFPLGDASDRDYCQEAATPGCLCDTYWQYGNEPMTFGTCANPDSDPGGAWCYIDIASMIENGCEMWQYCDNGRESADGELCAAPFTAGGVEFWDCTLQGEETEWCKTQSADKVDCAPIDVEASKGAECAWAGPGTAATIIPEGGTLEITDGSRPGQTYEAFAACQWRVTAQESKGMGVKATLTRLDIEEGYDYLVVFEGGQAAGDQLITTLSGYFAPEDLPLEIYSFDSEITIQFEADDAISGRGFSFTLEAFPLPPPPTVPEAAPCSAGEVSLGILLYGGSMHAAATLRVKRSGGATSTYELTADAGTISAEYICTSEGTHALRFAPPRGGDYFPGDGKVAVVVGAEEAVAPRKWVSPIFGHVLLIYFLTQARARQYGAGRGGAVAYAAPPTCSAHL